MTLVAVTACPTGIAHTYMAAERLEKAGRKLGLSIKVETQGAMGIENELTAADVAAADAVILAVGIPVLRKERFAGKKIFEIPVQDAIKSAEGVLTRIKGELGL
jgi:fructose-specific phosphotransferase system IIB component